MAEVAGQLAFDFEGLARAEARATLDQWQGAPLHFTTDYYPPGELDEAFMHWKFLNGNFGSYARSHMWHRGIAHDQLTVLGEHSGEFFTTDLRPAPDALGPGQLLAQMICEPCNWHAITEDENTAVEAWHDHALPGWTELPVVPAQIRVRNGSSLTTVAKKWIAERYPDHMQVPGAPIITERGLVGTRHVPGYSPWGGYDLSAACLDRPVRQPGSEQAINRRLPDFATRRSKGAHRHLGRGLED